MTVQSFSNKIVWKYGTLKRKVGFQLKSANLVFAFIGVGQAQIFGCVCSKRPGTDRIPFAICPVNMKLSEEICFFNSKNFQENLSQSINELRQEQDFCDVTLVCEDNQQIKAHKAILSAFSYLLKNILKTITHSHPLLYFWDVKERDLSNIVEFFYTG